MWRRVFRSLLGGNGRGGRGVVGAFETKFGKVGGVVGGGAG